MKAIQVTQTGGPEVLTLTDLPAPTPKANKALIEIKAIGISFINVGSAAFFAESLRISRQVD